MHYQSQKFWDKYGSLVMVMGTVLVCSLFAGFVIWMAFKQSGSVVPALQGLTESIKSSQLISGVAR